MVHEETSFFSDEHLRARIACYFRYRSDAAGRFPSAWALPAPGSTRLSVSFVPMARWSSDIRLPLVEFALNWKKI